jgi:tripartite ATP-independent transporter DctM subunit
MENLAVVLPVYVALLIILIFSGMPVAFALGLMGVGTVYLLMGPPMAPAIGEVTWAALNSFVLSAIPLFIIMGFLLFESGLSKRIYDSVLPLLDRLLPGGLLHTNIVVGAVFAACSGSGLAACATIGSVALPEMESRGYQRNISAGSVAAGGTLGPLIPPSIIMIVYGAMTQQSIGKLFIAGIIPGIILASAYMIYIAIRVRLQPHLITGEQRAKTKHPWVSCLFSLLGIWPALILIIVVLGSIYTGVATPTEAAAMGCVVVLILTAAYRILSWSTVKRAIAATVRTTSMILVIYLSANLMNIYLSNSGTTAAIATFVSNIPAPPVVSFLGIVAMYLVLGMLMDSFALMIMTLPITFPIVLALGFDPIWYGVIMVMFLECGGLTPPIGLSLFILHGLRPEYPFMEIVKGCFPFFLVLLLVIFVMLGFPELALFLPHTMM